MKKETKGDCQILVSVKTTLH